MPQLHGGPMPPRYDGQLTKSWSAMPWTPRSPTHSRERSNTMEKPVVLITGALTGMARARPPPCAEDAPRRVAPGRRKTEGKALEAELRGLGADAAFIQADV